MAPRLAVVCVNYGSHALLAANLDPGLGAADIGVVVVDNLSSAAERVAVTALAAERGWDLVAMPGNAGFGEGVNAGVARARELGFDAFCALNPDAIATVTVLSGLRRSVEEHPMALVSPMVDRSNGRPWFRGSMLDMDSGRTRGGWPAEDRRWKRWLTGACLCFSDTAFQALGGFSPGWFLYWEDVDLSRRAAGAGLELVLREDLHVVHDEGGTQGAGERSMTGTYYRWNTRNRLLFASRHLDRRGLLRWVARTPAESRQIVLRGGRRQLLASPTPLVATLRGTLEGLAIALPALVRGPDGTRARRRGEVADGPAGGRQPQLRRVLVAHPSPDLYGSDRVVLETVGALADAGVEVVVALPGPGPLVGELASRGATVRFVEMPVLRKSALKPAGFVRLLVTAVRSLPAQLGLLRASGAEVLLVNTVTVPMWPLVARLARVPSVVHVHEAEAQAARLVNRVLYGPLVLADAVVANSFFTREVVVGTYPGLGPRVAVVPNPVPGPAAPDRMDVEGGPRLVCVGRLSPRKGTDVAVRALAELRRRGVPATLSLVGSVFPGYEWYEQQLRDLVAQEGLGAVVDFAGFSRDVWGQLSRAQVALVPSVGEESFGNTAVEALLARRALVVSDTSGLAEASQGFRAVRRVPPGDPGAVADAVEELWRDPVALADAADADERDAVRRHAPGRFADGMMRVLTAAKIG